MYFLRYDVLKMKANKDFFDLSEKNSKIYFSDTRVIFNGTDRNTKQIST